MAPDDLLDRIVCQCSLLENRGTEEITLETVLETELLIDEQDLETLTQQLEAEFEVQVELDEMETWKRMRDIVRCICTKLGEPMDNEAEQSSYAIKKIDPDELDVGRKPRRRGRPPSQPKAV